MSAPIIDPPTMVFITLPEDTKTEIARQIAEGKRPLNWRTPGHPDHEAWAHVLALHPEAGVMVNI